MKHFLLLVDGTADAAFAVDSTGSISAWNNAAVELFGVSVAEAVGVHCHRILQCADENGLISFEHCAIERTTRSGCPRSNFDLQLQTRNGRLWCNLSMLVASDSVSRLRHAVYIVRPCELRKRLEHVMSEFVRTQTRYRKIGGPMIASRAASVINVHLTSREIEILKRLAEGESTRSIASQLNISSATVNNHVKHILTKLDAHTRLEAIRHAENAGVI